MRHFSKKLFIVLFLCAGILTGCASVIPSEYDATHQSDTISGPILALAGEGHMVVAANPEGVYFREGRNPWQELEVPGITDFGKITELAVTGKEICVGTDGEGLHIFTEGVWEIRTARYGGLPDDHVFSIAIDGPDEGLPGDNLWIGTESGLAVRRSGEWEIYRPGEEWMLALTEKVSEGGASTFLGSGYDLGSRGEDSRAFRPPVTAISAGPGGIVFGGGNSSLALLGTEGLATVRIMEDIRIMDLLLEENVIWVGTDGGLLWGGLLGKNLGTPWPSHRRDMSWRGNLFATRDARPFLYKWHVVGYNAGKVFSVEREKQSLWVAYGKPDPRGANLVGGEESDLRPITDLRRYLSINDHIARKEAFVYESYGKKTGVPGDATHVLYLPESGGVWVGTTDGAYFLEK